MSPPTSRNGCYTVFAGALLGAGLFGTALALWHPGALKRAGSGADAVALAYFFAAPAAMAFGALVGGVVTRFGPPLAKTATAILWLAAVTTFAYGFIYYARGLWPAGIG